MYKDKHGRDQVIHKWLKLNMPRYANHFEHLLASQNNNPLLIDIMFAAFEAGIDLAVLKGMKWTDE